MIKIMSYLEVLLNGEVSFGSGGKSHVITFASAPPTAGIILSVLQLPTDKSIIRAASLQRPR